MRSPTRRLALVLLIAGSLLFAFYSFNEKTFDTSKLPIHVPGKPPQSPAQPNPKLVGPAPTAEDEYIDWSRVPQHYPVEFLRPFPKGPHRDLPRIQHSFTTESSEAKDIRLKRLKAVRESFAHTWEGYSEHAWMKDEVAPVSGGHRVSFGGWAATLVDSLDTLWIMDFKQDFQRAIKDVAKINFSRPSGEGINVFETTIRHLGGLLAAYDLSGEKVLLDKAKELGEALYFAFDTPNRMPKTPWYWRSAVDGENQEATSNMLIAELGSLSLEFTRLSQLTGDMRFFDAISRITDMLYDQQNKTQLPGMWPFVVDAKNGNLMHGGAFTLGAMSDSLYEYFPKEFMLLGGLSDQYRQLYEGSINVVKKYGLFRPLNKDNLDILISTAINIRNDGPEHDTQGQHLVCFVGGMIGIASKIFGFDDLKIARQLTDGCIWAYENMPTGIMPEIFHAIPCKDDCTWSEKKWHEAILSRNGGSNAQAVIDSQRLQPGMVEIGDRRYILRPEAIESIFIMYRITGDVTLQDKAWEMFTAIEKHTRTEIAHAALEDITVPNPPKEDKMESFWPAETLKYFYLIFSEPDVISLDEYVFNTEAHPLRRPKSLGGRTWWR